MNIEEPLRGHDPICFMRGPGLPTGRQAPLRGEDHHHGPRLQEERLPRVPCQQVLEELANLRAEVRVYDPFVPSLATEAGVFASVGSVEEVLSGAECAVLLVDHDVFWGISMETVKGS